MPLVNHLRFGPNGMGGYAMSTTDTANTVSATNNNSKKNSYKVTMLCWTLADDMVVSSGSDNLLRTWNWKNGDLLKVLSGHTDESFVLLAHPIHKEIILSVGHDAMLMVNFSLFSFFLIFKF